MLRILFTMEDYVRLILMVTAVLNYKFVRTKKAVVLGVLSAIGYIVGVHFFPDYRDIANFLVGDMCIIIGILSVEGKKKILFVTAAYFIMTMIDESLFYLAGTITGIPYAVLTDSEVYQIIVMSISLALFFAISVILRKVNLKTSEKPDIKNSNSFYTMLLLIGSLISLLAITTYNYKMGNSSISLFVISLLVLTLCGFFVYNNASKKYYQNTIRMNEKIMTAQKEYYESLLERESDTRKFRHDINNHMFCIKTLIDEGKYDEAEQYINGIDNKMGKLKTKYSTGNSLVNAIVNDIAGKYDGVELDWKGLVPEDLKISNMDVCIIFSNLLDNAFCAASGCEKEKMLL
ncbi:MAG TPA: hypothetical protein P5092_12565 [Ruminococcus sp.]|nr:hypothetical protein [Ruminococcus sp.]